jgi:hypothetical protein
MNENNTSINSRYLEDEHVFAHVLCQCQEASLGVVPRIGVQLLIIRVQRLESVVN